jgi:RNA polymerase sigma-70 factor (ECF subfamily)
MTQERVLAASASPTGRTVEVTDARFRADLARNVGPAYLLAAVIMGNSQDGEDAAQDAIERAWRARRSLRDASRFDAWFQRVVVNACRDRLRRRRAGPALMSIGVSQDPGLSALGSEGLDPLATSVARDSIRRAFLQLNVDQRIVVAMRFYLDLEVDEIARRLGTRQGTIKSRLHRALKTLRDSWEDGR